MGGLILVLGMLPVAWLGGTILNRLLEHLETGLNHENELLEYGSALGIRQSNKLDGDDTNRGTAIGNTAQ